ncbi:hypothetical protein CP883_09960 [Cutibacterium acnes]|nr:hypothetical protein CP883_09960 [Cutibacterium acnes]
MLFFSLYFGMCKILFKLFRLKFRKRKPLKRGINWHIILFFYSNFVHLVSVEYKPYFVFQSYEPIKIFLQVCMEIPVLDPYLKCITLVYPVGLMS